MLLHGREKILTFVKAEGGGMGALTWAWENNCVSVSLPVCMLQIPISILLTFNLPVVNCKSRLLVLIDVNNHPKFSEYWTLNIYVNIAVNIEFAVNLQ